MAQLASEETPSTPPNTTNVNDSTDRHPPQSIRRESTRLRTPSTRPGFIPTITDSRRALVPAARPGISRAKKTIVNHSEDDIDDNDDGDGGDNDGEDEDEEGDDNSDVDGDHDEHHSTKQTKSRGKKAFSVMKQVSSRTGKSVNIDTAQDSDEENSKVTGRKKKDPTRTRTVQIMLGFISILRERSQPGSEAGDPTWACRWCNNKFAISGGSYWNLKCHRDGVKIKNSLRSACAGRLKCIEAGANLPPTVAERLKALNHPSTGAVPGTLIGYVTKGRFTFDNKTLNKLLVIWIVRQSLPWLRMEDFHLRVAFDYTLVNTSLNSRIWAALHAHQLYLEQRAQVLQGIRDSDSRISLVSDVWTTKGSHKAFVGMSVCYITPDWKYVCRHLAMKYVSWHHNGKYLASPFANVLVKHGLHQKITHTTDSGSNNFTMAKGVAAIFRQVDATRWDVTNNHQRCMCHAIALILGVGLKALSLPTNMVRPEKTDKPFPFLYTIAEEEVAELVDEEIVEVDREIIEEVEIDPIDAEPAVREPGWEEEFDDADDVDLGGEESGIGFTLKKVDYICRRIASSPQKEAEWKLWAAEFRYTGPGLIGAYGIRWNIVYDSRDRAYEGRKVIRQLLENESDRSTGKSADSHFFRGYELSSKEWEDVNKLNLILKEFWELTKKMEGDGPKLPMVLYEYTKLMTSMTRRKEAAKSTALEPMFDPMIKHTQKYMDLAVNCDAVVMATFLHPAWRVISPQLFEGGSSPPKSQSDLHGSPTDDDSDDEEFNFYPQNSDAVVINTELERYNNGDYPLGIKGCVLGWWKAHSKDFPILGSLARDHLACAASSATVERTFSAAGQICATSRAGLAIRSIERCISSHMWLRNGVKLGGVFADCQEVFDAADANPKFDKYKPKPKSPKTRSKSPKK
ncbi:hypothetical protein PSTT_13627 [Puccinia striiformis]|uniref:HAT C-terminal dimerisation domain-containing protein n=1 Tax=Puccinia striiformis TaxID=27350 RepID=A0A2S4UQS8_9BASI|nr:hypothetical protein PSTT_13627 [Puccinia striiformis]